MARSAADFARLMLSLLPPSKWGFWTREQSSNLYKHLLGASAEQARIDQRMEDLVDESLTLETSELLEEWEADFNIPEDGNQLAKTDTGRRAEINTRLIQVGRQDEQYFIQIAAALGYTITIENFYPAIMDVMTMGDSVGDSVNLFYWKVWIDLTSVTESAEVNIETLIFNLNKVKPAHTMVLYDFLGAGWSRGWSKGFKRIPHYDNSWPTGGWSRGFSKGFNNAYDYDGVNYTGGFSQGFSIGFNRHSGGAFSRGFSNGFSKPH